MMAWRWLLSFPTDERMELDERMKRGEEILDGVPPHFYTNDSDQQGLHNLTELERSGWAAGFLQG
jgi:hypothetical protein